MGAPVVHFEVQAREPEKMQQFYAELFDWEIDTDNPMGYGIVDTGSEEGIRGGIGPAGGGQGGVTWYAQVDDLDAYVRRAEELGGQVVLTPMEVPDAGISLAMFADPEGNTVGLVKGSSAE